LLSVLVCELFGAGRNDGWVRYFGRPRTGRHGDLVCSVN
jgi:hypothetical protein